MFSRNLLYLKTLQLYPPPIYYYSSFISPHLHYHYQISKPAAIAIEFILNETQSNSPAPAQHEQVKKKDGFSPKAQISHPWREWVDLMEVMLKNGYFDEIGNPFANSGELGKKEANLIRTASLNFARDQYQLISHLSQNHIAVIAGSGCPSTDRKVVNSGKRLRAHVGINEANVCSSCILRGDCGRAFVKSREDEGGRTVDVMRFLLTYSLDTVVGSVENKPCLNTKVKESVRTLLKEMVDLRVEGCHGELREVTIRERTSSTRENDIDQERSEVNIRTKEGDLICGKCNFLNFARNSKCLRCGNFLPERRRMLVEEPDHLPLKKGDWICDECKFLNFARNTRCLQCKEKPPKRKLNPGEWECESCNYINFRKNMVCLKCDHKRPIASNTVERASECESNNAKDHETQPWFKQQKQYRNDREDSMKFVVSEAPDYGGLRSYNQQLDFVDFPIVGGKRDLQKKDVSKNLMVNQGRSTDNAREDTGVHNSSIIPKTIKDLASADDGEMAEWFGGKKKSQ